jgi:hypothetical protein
MKERPIAKVSAFCPDGRSAPEWPEMKRRVQESSQPQPMLPLILQIRLQKKDRPGKIPPNSIRQRELSCQPVLVHIIIVGPSQPPLDLAHGQVLRTHSGILEGIVRYLPGGQMAEPFSEPLPCAAVNHTA